MPSPSFSIFFCAVGGLGQAAERRQSISRVPRGQTRHALYGENLEGPCGHHGGRCSRSVTGTITLTCDTHTHTQLAALLPGPGQLIWSKRLQLLEKRDMCCRKLAHEQRLMPKTSTHMPREAREG